LIEDAFRARLHEETKAPTHRSLPRASREKENKKKNKNKKKKIHTEGAAEKSARLRLSTRANSGK
jgi:hypothetical protein